MGKAELSYIITTYNKLPYLKVVMEHLLASLESGEEVVVADGGSSDGTVAYLQELHAAGKIKAYVSGKDKGEAHGFNKAILLSEGEIIKVITDDDAFYYPAIRACKAYLLANPDVDVLGANTGGVNIKNRHSLYWAEHFENDYRQWQNKILPRFFFNGTCLMFRRSSLALLGLFNTSVLLTDLEYTLRVTGVARLAWCRGLVSVRILNEQSNNLKYQQRAIEEDQRLCQFYNYKHHQVRTAEVAAKQTLAGRGRAFLASVKRQFNRGAAQAQQQIPEPFIDFAEAHRVCKEWLRQHPLNQSIEFL